MEIFLMEYFRISIGSAFRRHDQSFPTHLSCTITCAKSYEAALIQMPELIKVAIHHAPSYAWFPQAAADGPDAKLIFDVLSIPMRKLCNASLTMQSHLLSYCDLLHKS